MSGEPNPADDLLDGMTTPEEIAKIEKSPATLAHLANILLSSGRTVLAVELARRALSLAPEDGEVQSVAAAVLRESVPAWHFSIVRDEARNAAYDAALRRNIRPGTSVLEVGAGTGLLAMMAVRAGAAEVTSCEANDAVAAMASEIVAANGFASRIKIVAKHSRDLEVGKDLDQPADLLVSEIVSNELLGQDVLGCMENVVGRLTRADACIIPPHGAVRVALAQYDGPSRKMLGSIDGFDLSPFNRLAPRRELQAGDEALKLRSEPQDLFMFDFGSGGGADNYRSSAELVSSGGRIDGIAQWIWLRMDACGVYENRPAPGSSSCWSVLFHPLASPVDSAPGERHVVHGCRDRTSIWLWADKRS
ncbi:MAG: 50S ribosomal protein L11 methyltransferase [bacterium]|nr:50S ribosomal protein L11 methyltransferase [bacterium]